MILIGQFDSPFVRRVGIALKLYALPFEHRPWSVFGNVAQIRAFNPLVRVPTLVLDSGEVIIESHCIIDYLDSIVVPDQRMYPATQPARHRAIAIAALATGLAEKAVSLFYEKRLHKEVSEVWVKRCVAQIEATLGVLESDRAGRTTPYWFADTIGHADIAVVVVLRFLSEAHPGLVSLSDYPSLNAHSIDLERLPVFQEICQPFTPSA
jgi:glutathione S-transferase